MTHLWLAIPLLVVGGLLWLAAVNGVSFSIDQAGYYAFNPLVGYLFGTICIALGTGVLLRHKKSLD